MTAEQRPFSVLLATDDSEAARSAEAWVSRLRWSGPCGVDILCVAGHGITRLGWGMQTYWTAVRSAVEEMRQSERLAAERIANTVGERLQHAGLTVRTWARQGDAAEEILAQIEFDQPDLVVLGPRGRSGLAEMLLGSVSHQVMDASSVPILLARQPRSEEGALPASILLLVDGSLGADAAARWIVASGWAIGAHVTVLGLLGSPAGVDTDEPETASELHSLVRGDAVAALDRLAEPILEQAAGLSVQIESGHPLDGALRAAGELAADLVVVARPSRHRGQDPFAGKVARYGSTSVLIVPRSRRELGEAADGPA